MPDVAAVLRSNGLGLVDDLIHAAQLEGVALPIAATIIAGESWGRNIWGADGGMNVRTNGTYRPRTPVTRAAYLAYRAEIRAGRIIRQGCGPAQATSAQYQDTADALGGCWVPLANMRSGFRGMGALMRRYGTRDGARRYNGSGDQAERYADNFMSRLGQWERRLAGASVAPAPNPAPTPPPTSRALGTELVLDPILLAGQGARRLFLDPVGPPAKVIDEAWVTLYVDGEDGAAAEVSVAPQRSGGGTGDIRKLRAQVLTDGSHTSSSDGMPLPRGTNQAQLRWTVSPGATAHLVPAFTAQ